MMTINHTQNVQLENEKESIGPDSAYWVSWHSSSNSAASCRELGNSLNSSDLSQCCVENKDALVHRWESSAKVMPKWHIKGNP